MTTIKFNDTTFIVEGFTKSTSLINGSIHSTGNCSILLDGTDSVNSLLGIEITDIEIYNNDELIYNLDNLNAHDNNINEYLSDEKMRASFSIIYDNIVNSDDNESPMPE